MRKCQPEIHKNRSQFSHKQRDRCVMDPAKNIYFIIKVLKINSTVKLQQFVKKEDLYTYPFPSSKINVYYVTMLNNNHVLSALLYLIIMAMLFSHCCTILFLNIIYIIIFDLELYCFTLNILGGNKQ